MTHPMVLLLTNSRNAEVSALADLLQKRFNTPVFRFNMDRWTEYSWNLQSQGYELEHQSGHVCRENEVGAVFSHQLRFEPPRIDAPAQGAAPEWYREEVRAVLVSLQEIAALQGKLALAPRHLGFHPGALTQMRVAARFFPIPAWQALRNRPAALAAPCLSKTLRNCPLGNNAILHPAPVNLGVVNDGDPWFLQQRLQAQEEVSTLYVAGRLFTCARAVGSSSPWEPAVLSLHEQEQVCGLMQTVGFSLARLDFLRTAQGLYFLRWEDEPSFLWMDAADTLGIMPAIAQAVTQSLPH